MYVDGEHQMRGDTVCRDCIHLLGLYGLPGPPKLLCTSRHTSCTPTTKRTPRLGHSAQSNGHADTHTQTTHLDFVIPGPNNDGSLLCTGVGLSLDHRERRVEAEERERRLNHAQNDTAKSRDARTPGRSDRPHSDSANLFCGGVRLSRIFRPDSVCAYYRNETRSPHMADLEGELRALVSSPNHLCERIHYV